MEWVLYVVGGLMLALTLLPFARSDAWWVRVFDFPRVQVALIAAAVIVAHPLVVGRYDNARWAFLAALALCVVYQFYRMFPYMPLAPRQVQQSRRARRGDSFTLLFANVLQTNRDSSRLRAVIRDADPDIILAIETDEWWRGQLADF